MSSSIGRSIESARIRQGLSQETLASQLGRAQQTISRWESGRSRPQGRDITVLAELLGLDEQLLRDDRQAGDSDGGAHAASADHPVRPLVPTLPFGSLTPEEFEEFVTVLISEMYPSANVRRLGGRGDDQEGFDILATLSDGRNLGIQCKRELQFGPSKVERAIAAAERSVDQSLIALGRAATKLARDKAEEHPGWALWDQLDLSRQVRSLPSDCALRIVRHFFPSYVRDFLGQPSAGPWASAEEYFPECPNRLLNHRQPLVGRGQEINEISSWAASSDGPNIGVVFGRGGLGKSKIMWEVARRSHPSEVHFIFLSMDQIPKPDDFETLPSTGRVVLIIDDDSRIEHLAGIASLLWQHRRTGKILVASRPDNEAILHDQFWRLGQMPARVRSWTLRDLSFGEACDLAGPLIGREIVDPWTQQLAGISADCPLIAVIAADLLRSGQLGRGAFASSEILRREVFRLFREGVARAASRTEAPIRRAVLAAVAAFQPVRLGDENFARAFTALTGISSWDEVNRRIRELEDSGLVLRRGDAVRVVPDMLGDVILADAAFDERAGRSTSFLPEAQKVATATPLEHLLINAARIEWQLRQSLNMPIKLSAPLWTTLTGDVLDSSEADQVRVMSVVAKAAYYQPKPAYDMVCAVLSKHRGNLGKGATARQAVFDSAARVLHNIAYNFQLLRPALETLWQLAQDDHRSPNAHPDHPLRVLKSLAEIRTGKPAEYIETVIDVAEEWLSSDYRLSPFEVLEPALELEITEQVSRQPLVIEFYAYPVDVAAVRDIRQRIVDLALKEARSEDVTAAVRALGTLEHAIRLPSGKFGRQVSIDEKFRWAREFRQILEQLGALGRQHHTDPCLRIAIRQALRVHVREGLPSTETAKEQLLSVAWTSDDELAVCLHDYWHRLDMSDEADIEDKIAAIEDENRKVAARLLSQQTPADLLVHLEHRLDIESRAFSKSSNDAAPRFLSTLFTLSQPTAKALCLGALEGGYPQLSRHVSQAIRVLADSADDDTIPIVSAMLESESRSLQRGAADALSWNRGPRADLLAGESSALLKLSRHKDEAIRGCIGRAAWIVGSTNRSAAYEILSRADVGRSAKLAGEILWGFTSSGPLRWQETTKLFRQGLLDTMIDFDSIGDFHLLDAISTMSGDHPLEVTRFLLRRADRLRDQTAWGYEALPYHWDPPLRIRQTEKFAQCLSDVRAWIQHAEESGAPAYLQYRGAEVFVLIMGEWVPDVIVNVSISEAPTSTASLISIARVLALAPLNFLFENTELVANLLCRAEAFGQSEADRLAVALFPLSFGTEISSVTDAVAARHKWRDRAQEIAAELPSGSSESRFFAKVAEGIQQQIDSRMERDLGYEDHRDW